VSIEPEQQLRVELGHALALSGSDSFRWFVQKVAEVRDRKLRAALHESGTDRREWLIGRVAGFDEALDVLDQEFERIRSGLEVYE